MGENRSKGLTATSGALLLLVCVMLSAASLVSNLLPYISHKSFAEPCTSKATAEVVEVNDIVYEGDMYYGPIVEYYHTEKGVLVHTAASSVIKSRKEWQVGDTVNIAYNPNSPGDLYITDDNEVVKNYKQSLVMSCVMVGIGVILLIIGIVRTVKGTDPGLYERKFIKTPDGRSFDEWAEEMKKKTEQENIEESTDEQENSDGEE